MFYYKDENAVYASNDKLPLPEITEEEYNSIMESLQPTEEEIRTEKEAQLRALMAELNISEQGQIDSLLAGDTVVIK